MTVSVQWIDRLKSGHELFCDNAAESYQRLLPLGIRQLSPQLVETYCRLNILAGGDDCNILGHGTRP